MVDVKSIRELRDRTHVGLGQCKQALEEAGGSVEKAIVILKKRGLYKLKSDSRRPTQEGYIYSYTHNDGKMAVLLEVNCETKTTASSDAFREFCEAVALQVASMSPLYLNSGDVPDDVVAEQRAIFAAQAPVSVPLDDIKHFVNNKMKKWYGEVCLMVQKSVMVPGNKSIEQLRADLVMEVSENIIVKRFVRWEVGK